MRTLETNDWILLNNIIYKIYTMSDITEMREQFLDQMKMLIDYDSADFHLASPDGENRLVSPVLYNCEEDLSMIYEEIDYSRGILYGGRTLLQRGLKGTLSKPLVDPEAVPRIRFAPQAEEASAFRGVRFVSRIDARGVESSVPR